MQKKNDLIPYYEIRYRLLEKDFDHPGQMKDFDSDVRKEHTGYVTANTAKQAEKKLIEDFHMLRVEILSKPVRHTMTREEYENG